MWPGPAGPYKFPQSAIRVSGSRMLPPARQPSWTVEGNPDGTVAGSSLLAEAGPEKHPCLGACPLGLPSPLGGAWGQWGLGTLLVPFSPRRSAQAELWDSLAAATPCHRQGAI